ncbi:PH domain protein [Dictyocaulus viviparus]|uniref:PH domain protein n=1 Tax=Dictyocaulus viviparus TaxID=29172 RepID=A0A0D8XVX0_DICVI|nr:PH domain protein [Dictyocaulus viviparus]
MQHLYTAVIDDFNTKGYDSVAMLHFYPLSTEPRVARTLVLLSKMLQRVANCCVSSCPLTSKVRISSVPEKLAEQWLSVILERIADDVHRQAMKNFFDSVSLEVDDISSQETNRNILKEGCLIECRHGFRSSWRPLMLQKRRFVFLTNSELIWHKSHDHLVPKGSILLADIRVVFSEQNSLIIKCDDREVVFQATRSTEAADWFSAIERQRAKLKKKANSNALGDFYESDIEREMESLHVLLMEHIGTLSYWQTYLNTNEPLPENCPVIPKSLDGSMLEGEDRIAHCSALSRTIAETIEATRNLEKRHEQCIAIYSKQGPGTKDNPIDDNNHPPLRRCLHRK